MNMQTVFAWNDSYLLGHAAIDETHREFVELVEALLTVDDAGMEEALAAFERHAEAHFEQENRWMSLDGFPARDCHVDEHDKVLASVREVKKDLAAGNRQAVRELAVALKDWFPGHADYMDSALATWLVRRRHAASPLVFRRNAVTPAETPAETTVETAG
ncbi:MAG TPA: hemerythrin [Oxalobacteraceae bacterium]|nr:hemerythrin [Oxalobacteraceae bacterium]